RIAGLFGGSLPEYGPLVGVEKGGADLAQAWVDNLTRTITARTPGVAAAMSGVRDAMGAAIAGVTTPDLSAAASALSIAGGTATVRHIHELSPGAAAQFREAGFDE